MKQRIMSFIGFMLALFRGFTIPDENERSTFLMNDHKADGPVSYPGGLLANLSGTKEGDGDAASAIKEASKELFKEFESIRAKLKVELEGVVATKIDALTKEKIEKMTKDMEGYSSSMKENNEKLVALEKDTAQKLAAHQNAPQAILGSKEKLQLREDAAKEVAASFMRTGIVDDGAKETLIKLYKDQGVSGQKEIKFLVSANTFILPTEISNIIDNVLSKESDILSQVEVVRTNTRDYRKLINRRGTGLQKVGESTVRVLQDAPLMAEVILSYGELATRYNVSVHALDDADFDVETEFLNSTGIDMAEYIDTDVVSGDGVNTIKGLDAFPVVNTPAFGSITRIQTGGVIGYDDVLDVVHGPRKRYRRNASWFIGKDSLTQIRLLEDSATNLIFQPAFNEGRFEETILGYPVFESESFGDPTVDGARLAYFGDFRRGYLIHMLRDTRMIRDPFTLKGFVEFYVWQRWGGGLSDSNAIVCMQKTIGES